jgi:hypothetical protein
MGMLSQETNEIARNIALVFLFLPFFIAKYHCQEMFKINYLKYLILGGLILNALGYDRSFLLGVAPQDGAPTWQLMSGLYMYVTNMGDEPYQKKKRAEAMYKIKSSALIHIPGYLFMENLKSFNEEIKE